MKSTKKNTISKSPALSFLGILASIFIYIVSTAIIDKINLDLLTGIFSSLIAFLSTYLILKFKLNYSETQKRLNEIQNLRKEIRNIADRLDKNKVFLSYSIEDKLIAKKIIRELEAINLNVWDQQNDLKVGDNLKEQVESALIRSDYVIFIITNNSIRSDFFMKEISTALDLKKKIFPVLAEKVSIPDVISSYKYASLSPDFSMGLQELLDSVQSDLVSTEVS